MGDSGDTPRGMRSPENALPSGLWRSELGISAIEYSLLGSLVAIGLILGLTFFGEELGNAYDNIGKKLEEVLGN
jgi:Flp pilus assembly pilin Flp